MCCCRSMGRGGIVVGAISYGCTGRTQESIELRLASQNYKMGASRRLMCCSEVRSANLLNRGSGAMV
jgi:hypothetical protein